MKSNVIPIFGASNVAPESDGTILAACLQGVIEDFGARNLALSIVEFAEHCKKQAA